MNLIGHADTKEQVKAALSSAKFRNKALPHMLFAGSAGCGKTSMAKEVAFAANVSFITATADDLKDEKSVKTVLKELDTGNYDRFGCRTGNIRPSILFLDEIHQLPLKGQEVLGIAMEEFKINSKKTSKFYWLPYFTLVGATTDDGILSKPFRDRFKLRFIFEPYSFEEITTIILYHAGNKDITISPKAARVIAQRSRGVPRISISYLENSRDYAISKVGIPMITSQIAEATFRKLGIDNEGLTKVELKILEALHNSEAPLGLDNLSIIVNENQKTLMGSAEPFLIQKGLITRSGRGRSITLDGISYLEKNGILGKREISRVDIDADFVRT